MTIDRVRYERQIRLDEVREEGQARLASSRVVLDGPPDVREVAATYLRGAGATVSDEPSDETSWAHDDAILERTLHALGVRDRAARDVAEGALRALLVMRSILGV